MEQTWILVANAGAATIYSFTPPSSPKKPLKLEVVGEYQHPNSRKRDSTLVSDREGQYQKGTSGGAAYGHGNFVEASDPHQQEAAVFARELWHHLEQGRVTNQYSALILVAAPHFLGLLRQCIGDRPIKHRLPIKEIHKDYTAEKPDALVKLLDLENQF